MYKENKSGLDDGATNTVGMTFTSRLTKILPYEETDGNSVSRVFAYGGETSLILDITSEEILIDGKLNISCGNKSLSIEIYRIVYVPSVQAARDDHDDYIVSDKAGLYPDRLEKLNVNVVRIVPHIHNQFYIIVKGFDPEVKKQYRLNVSFFNNGKKAGHNSIIVDYLPVALEKSKMLYTNWLHCDSIVAAHNVKPYGKSFYKIAESYFDLAIKSGVNMVLTPLINPPLDTYYKGYRKDVQLADVYYDNGKYSFNFEKLGGFIDFARGYGIKIFEFPPFFSQWDAKYAASVIIKQNGRKKRAFGWKTESDAPEYIDFLKSMLNALREYLIGRNMLENCYFHICDEAHDKTGLYKKLRSVVTDNLKGGKFLDTSTKFSPQENSEICDVLSVSQTEDAMKSGYRPSAIYYCWSDYKDYVSNRFFCMSLSRTAVIWIQAYLNDCKMLLHWGFNFYQDFLSHYYLDPNGVSDLGGVFPSGDAFVVYPDVADKKADSSLRLEAIAFGYKLYRLLLTHEKVFGKEKTKDILKTFGMSGYNRYPHNDEWLFSLEKLLLNRLAEV